MVRRDERFGFHPQLPRHLPGTPLMKPLRSDLHPQAEIFPQKDLSGKAKILRRVDGFCLRKNTLRRDAQPNERLTGGISR